MPSSYMEASVTSRMVISLRSFWRRSGLMGSLLDSGFQPFKTYNLGQNGWKIKTTPPPISMMEKMARFRCSASTSLNWGEGCFYFSFYSVQDCRSLHCVIGQHASLSICLSIQEYKCGPYLTCNHSLAKRAWPNASLLAGSDVLSSLFLPPKTFKSFDEHEFSPRCCLSKLTCLCEMPHVTAISPIHDSANIIPYEKKIIMKNTVTISN